MTKIHTNIRDGYCLLWHVNTLRPRQDGHHFPDDIFKRIFLNENVWISIKISLKCIPNCPINNIPALVQIMAWRRPGDKPLSEPMMVRLPTHICVTRPQWVKAVLKIAVNERATILSPKSLVTIGCHLGLYRSFIHLFVNNWMRPVTIKNTSKDKKCKSVTIRSFVAEINLWGF